MNCTVVVPARNEAENIGPVVSMLGEIPGLAVTVVDNGSLDQTPELAREAGALVHHEPRQGKGFAAMTGISIVNQPRVFLCDADIAGLSAELVKDLIRLAQVSAAPVTRLAIGRRVEDAPVTTFTALPLFAALGIDGISEPLGGLMLLDREFVLDQHLPGGWGFDVALTLAGLYTHGEVPELLGHGVSHRRKPLLAYRTMAHDVAATIMVSAGLAAWDHADCVKCGPAALQPASTSVPRSVLSASPGSAPTHLPLEHRPQSYGSSATIVGAIH